MGPEHPVAGATGDHGEITADPHDANRVIRDIATDATARYGRGEVTRERTLDVLLAAALDKDAVFSARSDALFALHHLASPEALEPLTRMLLDASDHEWLRGYAALVLAHTGGPGIFDPLIGALNAGNTVVRWFTVKALGHLRDRRAVDPLAALLTSEGGRTTETPPETDLRSDIAAALAEIGDPRALVPLVLALGAEDASVRVSLLTALEQFHDQDSVVPFVWAMLHRDHVVTERAIAARALGKIGDTRAVEPLIYALNDDDAWVRGNAVEALGLLGDQRALPALQWIYENDRGVTQQGHPVRVLAGKAATRILKRPG